MKQPAVCILASGRNGCVYTGVSSNLAQRVWQHREHLTPGFTDAHEVSMLVYCERHDSMQAAITREKRIKRWRRAWKLRLIEASNPCWRNL